MSHANAVSKCFDFLRVCDRFPLRYVQFYFAGISNGQVNANVSVEYTANNSDLDVLVTPISCNGKPAAQDDGSACQDFEIRATGRYVWFKAGSVDVTGEAKSNDGSGQSLSLSLSPPLFSPPLISCQMLVGLHIPTTLWFFSELWFNQRSWQFLFFVLHACTCSSTFIRTFGIPVV